MKINKPGLRFWILVLYLTVSISGLLLLNRVFQTNQKNIQNAMDHLELSNDLRQLQFYSHTDSLNAEQIMSTYAEAKGIVTLSLSEAKFYAALTLLLVIVISSIIFVVVLSRISKPLRDLKNATDQIREGNFSVHLPETGISDMRLLKNSFNVMSRELESIQQRLLVAEKEMIWKDMSRILAHEIKNPLTPIQLTVQRLEERLAADPASLNHILSESLEIIKQEIENLRLLAQDFSSFAKISKAQQEVFDPALSIKEICKSYSADYDMHCNLQPNLLIRFDKTHFYQIITNILQNAMDACETRNFIEVNLSRDKSFVVVSIRDLGCGIPTEDMSRIFEPYFSRKNKGTGLGLALVKKLCEANDTIIRAKSKQGEGSEFTLIIPEAKP